METITLQKNRSIWNMQFLALVTNPKLLMALLFADLSGILQFISKYVFSDFGFLKFLAIACILDLITGVWKVIVTQGVKAVTSKGLRDSVTKIISYGSFLIIIHLITHFEINGVATTNYNWINKAAYEFLILVEIKSVYENIIKISPDLDFIDPVIQNVFKRINIKIKKKDDPQ